MVKSLYWEGGHAKLYMQHIRCRRPSYWTTAIAPPPADKRLYGVMDGCGYMVLLSSLGRVDMCIHLFITKVNYGTFVPRIFRPRGRKFHGTFVSWNFRPLELSFRGRKFPGDESSMERKSPWNV